MSSGYVEQIDFKHSMPASEQLELQPPVLAPIKLQFLPIVLSQCKGPCLKLDADLPSTLTQQQAISKGLAIKTETTLGFKGSKLKKLGKRNPWNSQKANRDSNIGQRVL